MSALADAIQAFLNAEDWDDTRAVLIAQQELLLSPEAEEAMEGLVEQARRNENQQAADMFELHLNILRAAQESGIEPVFQQIKSMEQAQREINDSANTPVAKAVQAYLNAENWDATREVLRENQELLFMPEAEALLQELIGHAADNQNDRLAQVFELHLNILRAAKMGGIDMIFDQVKMMEAQAEADFGGNSDDHEHSHNGHGHEYETEDISELEGVPFNVPEMLGIAVRAFLGSAQDRVAAVQAVTAQTQTITDADALKFLAALQQALIAGSPSLTMPTFEGVYESMWEALLNAIERDGVDPDLLNSMMSNTMAVLGDATEYKDEWLKNLDDLAGQMHAAGAHRSGAFAEALAALIRADGNPAGLGASLDGIFAEAWAALIDELPH